MKRMWPAMFLGAALVSGCGGTDAAPVEPSRAGSMRTVGRGVDEGSLPNLVLASLESPTVVPLGSYFSARVKVCNQGTAPAEGHVHFYLSPTPEMAPGSGIDLGETSVGELSPGQCSTRDQPATSWQPDGGHYLVAIVDADGALAELSEDDNTRAHRLWIGQQAELVVTSIETPPFVRPGEAIPVRMMLCNQGTMAVSASAGLFLSTDAHVSPEDTFLAQTFPSWLEGGSCITFDETVSNPASEGTYFVGAVADPFGSQEEADEENNVLFGAPLGMAIGPDLVVSEVTAPVSTERDAPFTSSVTVCNRGTEGAGGFVRFYLSPDAELSPWEEVYGANGSVGTLEPGQCTTLGMQLMAQVSPEGAWYVGASVEGWGWSPELIESNNTRVSAPMGVGGMPDFVISDITVPSSVNPGGTFSSTVTVCNQGTRAGDTDLNVFLVSAPDEQPLRFLEGYYLGTIEAGACVTREISGFVDNSEPGPLYLRAHTDADGYRMELIEDNNTRTSEALKISV